MYSNGGQLHEPSLIALAIWGDAPAPGRRWRPGSAFPGSGPAALDLVEELKMPAAVRQAVDLPPKIGKRRRSNAASLRIAVVGWSGAEAWIFISIGDAAGEAVAPLWRVISSADANDQPFRAWMSSSRLSDSSWGQTS